MGFRGCDKDQNNSVVDETKDMDLKIFILTYDQVSSFRPVPNTNYFQFTAIK